MNLIETDHILPSGIQFSTSIHLTTTSTHPSSHSFINPLIPKTYTPISNLIIARSTVLHVFELRQLHHPPSPSSTSSDPPSYKLFHLCQHHLHGIITGLQRVSTLDSAQDGRDRLLISFKHAKVNHSLISNLHHFPLILILLTTDHSHGMVYLSSRSGTHLTSYI